LEGWEIDLSAYLRISQVRSRARKPTLFSMIKKLTAVENDPSLQIGGQICWSFQDANARFSELMRLALSDGPQHVTLDGSAAVVVLGAADFRRMQAARTGQLLVDALREQPDRGTKVKRRREAMPVRAVKL
jgi:antitoxin Phd